MVGILADDRMAATGAGLLPPGARGLLEGSGRAGDAAAPGSSEHRSRFPTASLHLRTTAHHHRVQGMGAIVLGRIFQPARVAMGLGLPAEAASNPAALLLHAVRNGGDAAADSLNGEFCFALWDPGRGRFLLGRDSSGSYPIFYQVSGGILRFASDLQLLIATFPTDLRVDERRIAQWLALVPCEPGDTFFQNVSSVPPGCIMAHEDGSLRTIRTWDPGSVPVRRMGNARLYADGLRAVLNQAVLDRLPADEVAATTLSGGLDSSSVTALAARYLLREGRPLHAFTAVPMTAPQELPNHFCDEWSRAVSVASLYRNVHHTAILHGRHLTFPLMDRFHAAEMQPIVNPANYDWLYEMCLCASQMGARTLHTGMAGNLTVSYSGQGALSSLARQGRLPAAAWLGCQMHRHGGIRWRAAAHSMVRPWLPRFTRSWVDRVRGATSRLEEYSLINLPFAQDYFSGDTPREDSAMTPLARRVVNLRRVDIGPTLHAVRKLTGIHVTDATNDRRVVEYCLSVPEEAFCQGGVPRSLIRHAMQDLLPPGVRMERMRGLQAADFGMRFQAEIPQALREVDRLRDVVLAARCLDLEAMRRMLSVADSHVQSDSQIGFWPKLLRALSMGRFLRSVEEGTLYARPG